MAAPETPKTCFNKQTMSIAQNSWKILRSREVNLQRNAITHFLPDPADFEMFMYLFIM